ncbi:unnamed protein product [Amoebophrya sp. A120]|nr:unnamed protein product [Amoebophrya sp. A120]|eukprot:GSA120T00001652001.1
MSDQQASGDDSPALGALDIFIVAMSLVGALGVGFYVSSSKKKNKDDQEDEHEAEDYFLSGRAMPWYLVGASLFASNIGAEHFVGMAGTAAYDGLAVALHEWLPIYLIVLLGYVFYPVYCTSGVTGSTTEFSAPSTSAGTLREQTTEELQYIKSPEVKTSHSFGSSPSPASMMPSGSRTATASTSKGVLKMTHIEMQEIQLEEDNTFRFDPSAGAGTNTKILEKTQRQGTSSFMFLADANAVIPETASSDSSSPTAPRKSSTSSSSSSSTAATKATITGRITNTSSSTAFVDGGSFGVLQNEDHATIRNGSPILVRGVEGKSRSYHLHDSHKDNSYRVQSTLHPIATIGEYLEGRFDGRLRRGLAVLCLITYITTKSVMTLYAGALLFEVFFPLGTWYSVYFWSVLLIGLCSLYTILGGLRAVMIVDAVQLTIFFAGGIVGLAVALFTLHTKHDTTLGANVPSYFLHVWRDQGPYEAPAPLFGIICVSLYYWCFDQFMIQRVLSAKSGYHVRRGVLFAGLLKMFSPILICFPGMVARALYEFNCRESSPAAPRSSKWCAEDLSNPREANKAYLLLVLREFPVGIKGIILSSMLAAMLSSLSSIYNSAGSLVTLDLYRHYRPHASEKECVYAGKVWQVIMTLLTLSMLPLVTRSDTSFYLYAQEIMGHLMPPLVALFLCGMFTSVVNTEGALSGLLLGAAIGCIRFATRSIVFLSYGGNNVCTARDTEQDSETSRAGDEEPTTTVTNSTTLSGTTPGAAADATTTTFTSPLLQDSWWICERFFWFSTELFLFSLLTMVFLSVTLFRDKPPSTSQLEGRTVYSVLRLSRKKGTSPSRRNLSFFTRSKNLMSRRSSSSSSRSNIHSSPVVTKRKSGYSSFEDEDPEPIGAPTSSSLKRSDSGDHLREDLATTSCSDLGHTITVVVHRTSASPELNASSSSRASPSLGNTPAEKIVQLPSSCRLEESSSRNFSERGSGRAGQEHSSNAATDVEHHENERKNHELLCATSYETGQAVLLLLCVTGVILFFW